MDAHRFRVRCAWRVSWWQGQWKDALACRARDSPAFVESTWVLQVLARHHLWHVQQASEPEATAHPNDGQAMACIAPRHGRHCRSASLAATLKPLLPSKPKYRARHPDNYYFFTSKKYIYGIKTRGHCTPSRWTGHGLYRSPSRPPLPICVTGSASDFEIK